jgi:hypothetical protein
VTQSYETKPIRIVQALVIAVLGAAVWAFVIVSGVMSRTFDGGIFLSTVAGIRSGLPLYSGVWDNKDPLFYGTMTAFSSVAPVLGFVMDWLWIALAAFGTILIARQVVSTATVVLLGVVVTPFLILGPAYEPGLTNTPGTAVALLCLGLLINRWWLWAGVAMGLLLFVKVLAFPVVVLCALVLLAFPSLRRGLVRVGLGLLAAVAAVLALMAAFGWLPGYLTMLQRNRDYSGDVIAYFGFEDSPMGHLTKFGQEWGSSQRLAGIALLVILVAGVVSILVRRGRTTAEETLIVVWLGAAAIGVLGVLSISYVWLHHAQALSLLAILAAIVAALIVEPIRWRLVGWVAILIAAFILSGWPSPAAIVEEFNARKDAFPAAIAAVNEVSPEARLLNTVPAAKFTFARFGSNDDGGFLADVRSGATLGCPEFHAYDFSPPETFSRLYACAETVDVIVKTDSFDVFGNGGVGPSVRPILDYVAANFDCLDVDARQLCIRKGF